MAGRADLMAGIYWRREGSLCYACAMKNYFAVFLLLSSLVIAQAAPPSDQSIEKMLQVMQVQKMLDQMVAQVDGAMQSGMAQSLQGQTPSAAQKAKMSEFQAKLSATIKDELSLAKTKDVYVQVYRETFTQDEVNSIIAFYGSPAGKAMVEKTPVVMQKAGALMQARMGPMTQKLQAMSEQFQKEMQATK